ncbi:MAG: sodium-translocating pyrophosphatase [Candidatus Diapherotrites archaeon]|uniref:K(+)-insensitive pyrophosphate-energized proton pump n=1 Tax=Candidatus Iainarchaeum sp. TaxID=3101447 RepID=A0A8T3YJM8_9ARCH|nr:sodium-translocating pyrophosphatase [Candidatus Diapherotrites archaeon]
MFEIAFVLLSGLFSLVVAGSLAYSVWKGDGGNDKIAEVAGFIREGAYGFMRRQYSTILGMVAVMAVALFALFTFLGSGNAAVASVSFVVGAIFSAAAGIISMLIAVHSNSRTAAAAERGLPRALITAFRGGSSAGLILVSLALLGVTFMYLVFGQDPNNTPFIIVGYAFGASFVALFAQLGGGMYTKAADVGADLVGKIEANIPEDDPRNPAVVADLVGDNVGDCAGRGADLFESTAAENIGAMILGVALFPVFGAQGVLFPLVAGSLGLIASLAGIFSVRVSGPENPMESLNRGFWVVSVLSAVFLYFATSWLLGGNVWLFAAGLVGIATAIAFVYITEHYTEHRFRPVRRIVEGSRTGAATNFLSGFALALESTGPTLLVISVSLLAAYRLGVMSGVPSGGLFGTAMATMGMLMSAAYVLAMDMFGPITDNAAGIAQFSGAKKSTRDVLDRLDSVGNTTKALTKGYAIGSASLAAFLLFSAYMSEVSRLTGKAFTVVNIADIDVFVGAALGALLVMLFTSRAIRGVSKTAEFIIAEVRDQFRDKGIMSGKKKPDYAKCVDITTQGALRNMVIPGLLVLIFPIIVGVLLKAEAVAAMLMVGTIVGILFATFLNNAGGAWDNAKKYIEEGYEGGKGSETHKAAVIGDTIGDPFKDTAGPSIHVLIKLLATITLVLAPLFL